MQTRSRTSSRSWATRLLAAVLAATIAAPQALAADQVNTNDGNKCSVLGGEAGVCFKADAAKKLLEDVTRLPFCEAERQKHEKRAESKDGELNACRVDLALESRKLGYTEQQVKALQEDRNKSSNPIWYFITGALSAGAIAVGLAWGFRGGSNAPPVVVVPRGLGVRF